MVPSFSAGEESHDVHKNCQPEYYSTPSGRQEHGIWDNSLGETVSSGQITCRESRVTED